MGQEKVVSAHSLTGLEVSGLGSNAFYELEVLTQEKMPVTIDNLVKEDLVTGVLCDRRMPDRLKGKIYKAVVRPVALYGSACWPALTTHEQALNTMEMRMLRWSLGITRRDRVTNKDIRKRLGVAPIKEKMLKSHLRWYGHVIRSDENSVAKTAMMIDPEGCRPQGRPKKRWMDKIKEDIKTINASPEDALDRTKWRNLCRRADPAPAGTTLG
ncbi:uncharacterized protein LOC134635401 [Pelmatolapia mariae]|uniref:uncharacterized protein LOC134635401 n=1 Tax=Pelmatolapia mariae TaxID=158779 RepID=UPI002FE6A585